MRGTLFCGALLTGLCCAAVSADDDAGEVYTDPEQAGVDYAFQGEYRGYQRALPTARSSEPIGLQVIARGDGKFDAVKYYGGLPGDGWWGGQSYSLSGELVDGVVPFYGDRYVIMIEDESGAVFDADGRMAGALTKVQRLSPTMHAPPPPGAIELFTEPADTSRWNGASTTEAGLLQAGCETAEAWGDFRLHAEFRLPFKPRATGQARGNSGFYLQGRYEVQVLDSFGLEGLANECGALYRTRAPDLNMCLPPLQWQTYDIVFRAPRFDDARVKLADARISVWHNGVLIHDDVRIPDKTGAGRSEGPEPFPTKLQDHGNPVVFRNIWLIPLDEPGAESWPEIPESTPPIPVAIVP
jgi:hypothetical protein